MSNYDARVQSLREKVTLIDEEKWKLLDNVIHMSDQQLDMLEELVRDEISSPESIENILKFIEAVRAWKEETNDLYPSQTSG